MKRWMDGWMYCMQGWMDGWKLDGCTVCRDGWIDEGLDDRWMDG